MSLHALVVDDSEDFRLLVGQYIARSEERRGGKEWSSDVCSSDLRFKWTDPRRRGGSHEPARAGGR